MAVRAQFTQYAVPGWGVGELWTSDAVLLTHEFRFQAVSDTDAPAEVAASKTHTRGRAAADTSGAGTRSEGSSAPGTMASNRGLSCGAIDTRLSRVALDKKRCLTPDALVARFVDFFAGREVTFDDVPLDLDWATAFQRAVADALRAVPRGEVVSYGELAAIAGYPGAARAAGSFCAHNRFMLVVPCHRVVGAHGLGGYGSAGVDTKRRLLALEGVAL